MKRLEKTMKCRDKCTNFHFPNIGVRKKSQGKGADMKWFFVFAALTIAVSCATTPSSLLSNDKLYTVELFASTDGEQLKVSYAVGGEPENLGFVEAPWYYKTKAPLGTSFILRVTAANEDSRITAQVAVDGKTIRHVSQPGGTIDIIDTIQLAE